MGTTGPGVVHAGLPHIHVGVRQVVGVVQHEVACGVLGVPCGSSKNGGASQCLVVGTMGATGTISWRVVHAGLPPPLRIPGLATLDRGRFTLNHQSAQGWLGPRQLEIWEDWDLRKPHKHTQTQTTRSWKFVRCVGVTLLQRCSTSAQPGSSAPGVQHESRDDWGWGSPCIRVP